MAGFETKDLILMVPRVGGASGVAQTDGNTYSGLGLAFWSFRTVDALATVVTANYITTASALGIRDGDYVFARILEGGSVEARVFVVENYSATDDMADLVEIEVT
jgi:hypothetical protein